MKKTKKNFFFRKNRPPLIIAEISGKYEVVEYEVVTYDNSIKNSYIIFSLNPLQQFGYT